MEELCEKRNLSKAMKRRVGSQILILQGLATYAADLNEQLEDRDMGDRLPSQTPAGQAVRDRLLAHTRAEVANCFRNLGEISDEPPATVKLEAHPSIKRELYTAVEE